MCMVSRNAYSINFWKFLNFAVVKDKSIYVYTSKTLCCVDLWPSIWSFGHENRVLFLALNHDESHFPIVKIVKMIIIIGRKARYLKQLRQMMNMTIQFILNITSSVTQFAFIRKHRRKTFRNETILTIAKLKGY